MQNTISSIPGLVSPQSARAVENRPDASIAKSRMPAMPVAELPNEKQAAPVSGAELEVAVKQINDFIQIVKRDLRFTIDEHSGRTIVTVLDSETQEVVRQIPSEEVLAFAENLDQMRGGLLKAKA